MVQSLRGARSEKLHNLPLQLTSLVGRDQEAAAIEQLLQRSEVRLLTLTGPAGVGKTRLAIQVASNLLRYYDGAYFVSLASLRDADQLTTAIAQTLVLMKIRGQTYQELLREALKARRLLLVLDNFEQIISGAPLLIELLETCPDLKLIVTSREVLRLRAEFLYSVSPLALPDLTYPLTYNNLANHAAVDLFLQRARAVKPDFRLTPANARSIAEICDRLDGLPLALELAAARIKLLSPQTLLALLSQRLRVLTNGARDAPARQQTLRNTIEWSYKLLNAEEQQLFRRLSIFTSGCTLEEIEGVCALSSSEAELILDRVTSLVDKSLLQQHVKEEGNSRFVMLETIREYALGALAASDESVRIHDLHATCFLQLAELAMPQLNGSQQALWYRRLEQERENLHMALEWLIERDEFEQALRLCTALWGFWLVQGYWSIGRAFMERALEPAGSSTPSLRAATLNGLGLLLLNQWECEQARQRLEESVALYRELGDLKRSANPLRILGLLALMQGEYSRAEEVLGESLTLLRDEEDKWDYANLLCTLSKLYQVQDDYSKARSCAVQSLELFQEQQDSFGISRALHNLANLEFIRQSDLSEITALLQEFHVALARSGAHHMWAAEANHLEVSVALRQGDVYRARSIIEECLVIYRMQGYRQDIPDALLLLAQVATQEENYASAQAHYQECLQIATEIGYKSVIPACLEGLANIAASSATQATKHLHEPLPTETSAASSEERRYDFPTELTPRQIETLQLLARGFTSAQIAEKLVISIATVNFHVRSIYSKLGVNTRSAATRYAFEHQLV